MMFTIEPNNFAGPGSAFLSDEAAWRSSDDYLLLSGFAAKCALLNTTVLIRFAHEMNGWWYDWCVFTDDRRTERYSTANMNAATLYKQAFQRVAEIFHAAGRLSGKNNIRMVWCPNYKSAGDVAHESYTALYPGDDAVDFVGIDRYNFYSDAGTHVDANDVLATTMDDQGFYTEFCEKRNKPLILCETAAEYRPVYQPCNGMVLFGFDPIPAIWPDASWLRRLEVSSSTQEGYATPPSLKILERNATNDNPVGGFGWNFVPPLPMQGTAFSIWAKQVSGEPSFRFTLVNTSAVPSERSFSFPFYSNGVWEQKVIPFEYLLSPPLTQIDQIKINVSKAWADPVVPVEAYLDDITVCAVTDQTSSSNMVWKRNWIQQWFSRIPPAGSRKSLMDYPMLRAIVWYQIVDTKKPMIRDFRIPFSMFQEFNTLVNDPYFICSDGHIAGDSFELNVFPNPAMQYVTVSGRRQGREDVEVSLYNSTGTRVGLQEPAICAADSFTQFVPTGQYSPGVYYLSVRVGVQSELRKIVIIR